MDANDPVAAQAALTPPSIPAAPSGPASQAIPTGPLDRPTALALLARADALLADGDFGPAAAHYQRVVGFDDHVITAQALLGLGDSLYRLDQDAGAIQTWESIPRLAESPSTYQAWRRLASARVRDKDLTGAIEAYRQADRRAPAEDRAEIASRLGWLAKETGDRRAAGRYFARSRGDGPAVSAARAVIGITVAVSLIAMYAPGNAIDQGLQLDKVAVAAGEWWRLLSVTLLHAGLLHLGFNMYALYLVGPVVERQYGWKWFLVLYLLCALGGSIASYMLGSGRLAVGASGAIFGLFGVLIAANRTHRPVLDRQARMVVAQLGSIVLINLVLGFMIPGIDNLAHLGGLVTGAWLGFVVRPGKVPTLASMWVGAGEPESPLQRRLVPLIGIALLVILMVAGMVGGQARWASPVRTPNPGQNGGTVSAPMALAERVRLGG